MALEIATEEAREKQVYSNFIHSLRSPETKKHYAYALDKFMKFHNLTSFVSLLLDTERGDKIKQYVIHLQQKGVSATTFDMFFAAMKNFYEMNDIDGIKWKKLRRFVGELKPEHESRTYTHEEINTLVQSAPLKLKCAILLMCSCGARVGSITDLKVSSLDMTKNPARLVVYSNSRDRYTTFITPEAQKAITDYLDFRKRSGEKIGPDSPLFRKDFDHQIHQKARFDIQPWNRETIQRAIRYELEKVGLRVPDHTNNVTRGKKRYDVKSTHGFRSFFETMLVNTGIHETVIRKLMNHSEKGNLTQLYSKQTIDELASEYEKAIPLLTINEEVRLRTKVQKLEVERDSFEIIRAKIAALEQKINA